MKCREDCGACCIMPSISSPIPVMPNGKPAGVRCIHLTTDLKCAIYNSPERPAVCEGFNADKMVCGSSRHEALSILAGLENLDIDISEY